MSFHFVKLFTKSGGLHFLSTLVSLKEFLHLLNVFTLTFSVTFVYTNLQLCFSRQFWSSINLPSYMALRLGFITVCFSSLNGSSTNIECHVLKP